MSSNLFIDELLRSKKLLFVTGKGGIGKSLMACALAKRARSLGLRVLVVEQSMVEQVGPLLGFSAVCHEETWNGDLGVANFTPGGNFRDFITKHLMKSSLLDVIVSNKIVHSFFTSIPGFAELMLLGRIYYGMNLATKQRPDITIVDSYASGHFISLMTTPDAVLKSGLAGPIIHLTAKVRDWLANRDSCGTIYVAVPEDLVVSETLEFLPQLLAKSPVSLSAVMMNRCLKSMLTASTSPAFEFLSERINRQTSALTKYSQTVSSLDGMKDVKLVLVPEMGSIAEPINENDVNELFGGIS